MLNLISIIILQYKIVFLIEPSNDIDQALKI